MQFLGSIPEQGQLAVVRQRRYVVLDVRTGVNGGQIGERPQHLVSLTSIEDDALASVKSCKSSEKSSRARGPSRRWNCPSPKASTSPPTSTPSSTPSAGAPHPSPTHTSSNPPSAAVSKLKATSSTRSSAPPRCRASTCSLPTTWASARPTTAWCNAASDFSAPRPGRPPTARRSTVSPSAPSPAPPCPPPPCHRHYPLPRSGRRLRRRVRTVQQRLSRLLLQLRPHYRRDQPVAQGEERNRSAQRVPGNPGGADDPGRRLQTDCPRRMQPRRKDEEGLGRSLAARCHGLPGPDRPGDLEPVGANGGGT